MYFFCICLMRNVLFSLATIFMINPYLKRECKKAVMHTRAPVNIKTATLKVRYLCHFCVDIYMTKRAEVLGKDLFNDM